MSLKKRWFPKGLVYHGKHVGLKSVSLEAFTLSKTSSMASECFSTPAARRLDVEFPRDPHLRGFPSSRSLKPSPSTAQQQSKPNSHPFMNGSKGCDGQGGGGVGVGGNLSLCRATNLHLQAGAQRQCPAAQSISVATRSVASRPTILLEAEQRPVFVNDGPHRKAGSAGA